MARPYFIAGDLFIRRQIVHHDSTSMQFYDSPDVREPRWVVNCRNPRNEHRTSLPLGFATFADATRAVAALVEAGLDDTESMHHRIKVQRDWPGVRAIMIQGLAW